MEIHFKNCHTYMIAKKSPLAYSVLFCAFLYNGVYYLWFIFELKKSVRLDPLEPFRLEITSLTESFNTLQ